MKKIILISFLLLEVISSHAQLAIIYRGDYNDGFAADTANSFVPNYGTLTYYQSMFLGDNNDGFAADAANNFVPNYGATAYYQAMFLGDNSDGFAIDGEKNFTPNYSNLQYYQGMFTGDFGDGFAMDSTSYFTPLPVILLSFDGNALENNNYLYWKTANEENVSHFALGKGKNGADFTSIAQVSAKGNSSVETKYNYNDYHDIAGSNYYRLKIIDNDKQFSYSKVVKLSNSKNNFSILLAPNPANDYLSIKFSEALKTDQSIVKVISNNGQVIMLDKLKHGTLQHNLNLTQISSGAYYILVDFKNEVFTLPFVKQ